MKEKKFMCVRCKKKEATYYVFCGPECEKKFDTNLANAMKKKIEDAKKVLGLK
jgi:hypothetical protein